MILKITIVWVAYLEISRKILWAPQNSDMLLLEWLWGMDKVVSSSKVKINKISSIIIKVQVELTQQKINHRRSSTKIFKLQILKVWIKIDFQTGQISSHRIRLPKQQHSRWAFRKIESQNRNFLSITDNSNPEISHMIAFCRKAFQFLMKTNFLKSCTQTHKSKKSNFLREKSWLLARPNRFRRTSIHRWISRRISAAWPK